MLPICCRKLAPACAWGTREILDHMFFDGLQSPFDGKMMGHFADATSTKYGFTREQQDEFAAESVRRAVAAVEKRLLRRRGRAVTVKDRKGERIVAKDETPFTCDIAKIPSLKPAFNKDGTVTAASSSSISDGAAALIVVSAAARASAQPEAARAHRRLRQPRAGARVVHDRAGRRDPIRARQDRLVARAMSICIEINEAFACVAMAAIHDLEVSITPRSTSTAARARSAIRSAPPARESSRRWSTR